MQGTQTPSLSGMYNPRLPLTHTRGWSRGKRFESARQLSFYLQNP
jgi:hypothetical protein